MRLNKYQKARLLEHEWDVYESPKDGGNTAWISIEPEDGEIFHICTELFGLTGEGRDIQLLVVASKENFEGDDDNDYIDDED